ncbi:MAG: dienelactone hydrolase family protein [Gemmatimonadales bacterium]
MRERAIALPVDGGRIDADLAVPDGAAGLVVFAHGSGSDRRSPRNRRVAASLRQAGFATLLVDLLTAGEVREDEVTRAFRFDLSRLAGRLNRAVDAMSDQPDVGRLPVGCFGASTGAAAALITAAERGDRVAAVVSRGGRPDLAGGALRLVRVPTLMIVGGNDPEVLVLNRTAAEQIPALTRIEIVPGATHLFPEPGAMDTVVALTIAWFRRYLAPT